MRTKNFKKALNLVRSALKWHHWICSDVIKISRSRTFVSKIFVEWIAKLHKLHCEKQIRQKRFWAKRYCKFITWSFELLFLLYIFLQLYTKCIIFWKKKLCESILWFTMELWKTLERSSYNLQHKKGTSLVSSPGRNPIKLLLRKHKIKPLNTSLRSGMRDIFSCHRLKFKILVINSFGKAKIRELDLLRLN